MGTRSIRWTMLLLTNVLSMTSTKTYDAKQNNVIHHAYPTIDNTNIPNILTFLSRPQTKRESYKTNAASNKEIESRKPSSDNAINNGGESRSRMGFDGKNPNVDRDLPSVDGGITRDDITAKQPIQKETNSNEYGTNDYGEGPQQREIDDAIDLGLKAMLELTEEQEPLWYRMGLFLDENEPGSRVAKFGKPNRQALELSKFGFASVEASKRIAQSYPKHARESSFSNTLQSRLLLDECPLRGDPRCPSSSRIYRTADGTCNNLERPWRGSALLPMQRFLPPNYDDGVESIRKSVFGTKLPSARDVSVRIHRDKNHELPTVTLMFMQWGQFVDHDVTSTVKSRSFNGSVPRCCTRRGRGVLPKEVLHPSCLPIEVSDDDWFLSKFGIKCLEFIRSAPSTRIDCDLGWREQINQVTSYVDASMIYGSDIDAANSLRTFRNGKLQYGRPLGQGPLQPRDPPGGELCRSGALLTECFQTADGRFSEQTGLTAMHTVWLRYHNRLATTLGKLNKHWSDEKIYQETRKIIGAFVQHITYREFLPIVLGQEVMELFELKLESKGYYNGYDGDNNPTIANSFSSAAFRFGHSLVQNSYVRFDSNHRPLSNNVTLHEELDNIENIWSFGSIDRLLLGFMNQPAQRRDEFICDELTNQLFRPPGSSFGLDLAAINIQRGRDHGLPAYTEWREPCGLSRIKDWKDLEKVISIETTERLRSLYDHIDDVDLFTGGLAEKPVRGGLVGPTFACIIAQQFLQLRKGDRFWYENGGFSSSFTPAQLQQIRRVTLSEVLCQTLREIETVQPFAFLSSDDFQNVRLPCDHPILTRFDLAPWAEDPIVSLLDSKVGPINFSRENVESEPKLNIAKRSLLEIRKINRRTTAKPGSTKKPRTSTTRTRRTTKRTIRQSTIRPLKIPIGNVTLESIKFQTKYEQSNDYYEIPQRPSFSYNNPSDYGHTQYIYDKDYTYLFGYVKSTTPRSVPKTSPNPVEVNIKIQYYPQTSTTTKKPTKNRRTTTTKPKTKPKKPKPIKVSNKPVTSYPIYVQPTRRPTSSYDQSYNNNGDYKKPQNDYVNIPNGGSLVISYNGENYSEKPLAYADELTSIQRPTQGYNGRPTNTNHRPTNNGYMSQNAVTNRPLNYFNIPAHYESKPTDGYDTFDPIFNDKPGQYHQNDYTTSRIPNSGYYAKPATRPVNPYYYNQNQRPDDGYPRDDLENNEYSKPTKLYTMAHIEKVSSGAVNEMLDFKTKYVYKNKFPARNENDRFVKISSVKGEADLSSANGPSYEFHSVQQRAGDLELYDDSKIVESDRREVVDLDIIPSETSANNWSSFDETSEDLTPELQLPDLNVNIPCSDEIPHKMTLVDKIQDVKRTRKQNGQRQISKAG